MLALLPEEEEATISKEVLGVLPEIAAAVLGDEPLVMHFDGSSTTMIGGAIVEMGARKIHVTEDSNLVLSQVQGSFVVKEVTMAPYRTIAEKLMTSFKRVVLEHIPDTTNRYTNALPILGSKLTFIEEQPNIVVIRKEAPAIDTLFLKEAPKGNY
ncbi:hypothetical protein D8674_021211 [Pyrus ussuriensis x Pyrus communis]|uniref:RNase H type-1 domain-containing protein n=1 Tax=Pyrus ussuriensis x Pyrus communis TaxID=2448454 RepID=A0A5N5GID3_9ROSA|nr:hypothetical protein D8674_021211 [Pyrus ussuriensis x Pyrus communis]